MVQTFLLFGKLRSLSALFLIFVIFASVSSLQSNVPAEHHVTFVKYGCMSSDRAERNWGEYLGLSGCR